MDKTDKRLRINERIRAREIRVIDESGEQVGIMAPSEALAIAQSRELDLIEVAPQARPPVCRIMDYGRWKYEQRKREKEAHKASRSVELKTVRMRPHTDDHDFATKARTARKFLAEGKKVRVTMLFRGREMMHQRLAREKVLKMGQELADICDIERMPTIEGRQMSMILNPKPQDHKAQPAAQGEPKPAPLAEAQPAPPPAEARPAVEDGPGE